VRAKSISEPVGLIYKANIMQNTKEEWKNIKLKISSANPNLGNVATQLKPYYLNYSAQPPRYNYENLSGEIRGRVFDSSGETLPGAAINIVGTTIGTVTDLDGNFTMTRPANGGSLQVSYVGFISQTLPISNNFMNIVMEENQMALDEVVVSALGVASESKSMSFARQTVKAPKSKSIPIPSEKVENATSVEFEIKTPYTLPSENKNTSVAMAEYELPAQYEYYCAPKADKDVFLLANIADWEQYNLLEGEANIFFENTFVGKTILDVRYMSDTLNISLGRDRSVTVRREKAKDFTSKKFLSSKAEVTRNWTITVKNNKSQAIDMVLFDQIPVSTLDEIEVTPEQLSGGQLSKESGAVKWKFTLPAAQENKLELMYKVKYPKDRNLTIE
jgi:hypothetical protein